MKSSQENEKRTMGALSGRCLRERALDLLSRREHSEGELSRKLLEKGGESSEIAALLNELKERGYLDDRRFAENFLRYRESKSWGRDRFRQELTLRGVSKEIAEEALRQSEQFEPERVRKKLSEFIDRQLRMGKEPRKIAASLMRKGFRPGDVRACLEELDGEEGACET